MFYEECGFGYVRICSGIVACANLIGRGEERASIFAYILYPVSVFEQCEILFNLGHIFDEFVL